MSKKEKLLYSLNYSIEELSNEITNILNNNSIPNKEDLYRKIGESLHWIYDCIEKTDFSDLSSNDNNYIIAFRGAANAQKHSKEELNFDDFINCATFPFTLPAVFSNTGIFNWKPLNENVIRQTSQIKKYNEVLANHSVVESLNIIKKIITDNL